MPMKRIKWLPAEEAAEPSLFPEGPHGNPNPTYIGAYKRGCRCEECLAAYKRYRHEYHKARLAADPRYRKKCSAHVRSLVRQAKAAKDEISQRTGQTGEHARPSVAVGHSGYVKGCRCQGCVSGNREYRKAYEADRRATKAGRVAITNAARRKWSRIKGDVDQMSRLAERARRQRVRRRKWLSEIKLASGCVDCGYNANAAALDFDHISGVKAFTIGPALTYSKARLLEEIAKCEVRCANCHRVRTYDRAGRTSA